jgi:hypothetical protein
MLLISSLAIMASRSPSVFRGQAALMTVKETEPIQPI